MSGTEKAYDKWSEQYDSNVNPTRDLEAGAIRAILCAVNFEHCLEIGCGTGKNTVWLKEKASVITAVDFSAEMLEKAKQKIGDENVRFVQADLTRDWDFTDRKYDLVTFSLVLEHIEKLDPVFEKVSSILKPGGHLYIGELHPFKQYTGSKARFENEDGLQVLNCYPHHISDFTEGAEKNGLELMEIREYFDDNDRRQIPRILSLLFQKPAADAK
jgi:ubiquinone/menaquinone biosynthesis C-methylase UbiE